MENIETAENDNKTTAAAVSETTGDDLGVAADYDSEPVKPLNMKLKAAMKALLQASVSEDEEMRSGATQSLVKLGLKHPLRYH